MKRKLFTFLTSLLIMLSLPLTVFASESPTLVIDSAGLFTADETAILEEKAQALRNAYDMDVVILTVDSLDGSRPQDYADDYYVAYGYGCGEDYSGMLFLMSMEERDWYITACGDGSFVLTDYGKQASAEKALPYFRQDDYFNGFAAWLDVLPAYFDAFQDGQPIDGYADYSGDYYHGDQEEILYYEEEVTPSIFLSLITGLVIAGIAVLVMRFSMNTKRPNGSAADYLVSDSYRLRNEKDVFLYSQVTKTERPQENDNDSSGGGGSSVHTHSSGRKFSGGGGKF